MLNAVLYINRLLTQCKCKGLNVLCIEILVTFVMLLQVICYVNLAMLHAIMCYGIGLLLCSFYAMLRRCLMHKPSVDLQKFLIRTKLCYLLCCVRLCNVISCNVISRHAILCHAVFILCYVTSHNASKDSHETLRVTLVRNVTV